MRCLCGLIVAAICSGLGVGGAECQRPSDAPPPVAETTFRGETPSAGAELHVSPVPDLTVGLAEGSVDQILASVFDAFSLSDGTIVVRNSINGLFELRYFSPTGALIARASRFGDGPYEFRFPLGQFRIPGDSALVFGRDGRVAVFGPRGEPVRESRLDVSSHYPMVTLLGLDRSHVVLERRSDPPLPLSGPHSYRIELRVLDLESAETTFSLPVQGQRFVLEAAPGEMRNHPYPFAPNSTWGTGGGLLWVAQADSSIIRAYDARGLRTTIRFEVSPPRVSRGDLRRFREHLVDRSAKSGVRQSSAYARRQLPSPEHYPPFGEIEVDVEGNLWVKHYETPWAEGPQMWSVFGRDGALVATAEIPEELISRCQRAIRIRGPCDQVLEIGTTYVLMRSGEGEVPRVRRYGISKKR